MNWWKLATILLGACTAALAVAFLTCYYKTGTLTLSDGANIATIVGNTAVAVSIFFIAYQLQLQSAQMQSQSDQAKLQTQLAKASNSQAFVTLSSDFLLNLVCNEKLMKFYRDTGASYETQTDDVKARYRHLITWWLNFYENVVYQEKSGLLDSELYSAWEKEMRGFVARRHVEKVWDDLKDNYGDLFIARFQPIIDERRAYVAAAATLSTLTSTLTSALSPPPSSPPSSPPASIPSSPPSSPLTSPPTSPPESAA